jgi:hypothetical protein
MFERGITGMATLEPSEGPTLEVGPDGEFLLGQLPDELLVMVLTCLHPRDVLSASSVCRGWHISPDRAEVWRYGCASDPHLVVRAMYVSCY